MSKEKEIEIKTLDKLKQLETIRSIVNKLYARGATHRTAKHGNPDTLINNIIKNQTANKPATVGIFSMLPTDIMEAINKSKVQKGCKVCNKNKPCKNCSGKKESKDSKEDSKKLKDKKQLTFDQEIIVINKLLQFANKASKEYYCYINDETLNVLTLYKDKNVIDNKKYGILLKNALNFRTIFLEQERQKVSKHF